MGSSATRWVAGACHTCAESAGIRNLARKSPPACAGGRTVSMRKNKYRHLAGIGKGEKVNLSHLARWRFPHICPITQRPSRAERVGSWQTVMVTYEN